MADELPLHERLLNFENGDRYYPPAEDGAAKALPHLWKFLTCIHPKPGYVKDPAFLKITMAAGEWSVDLVEPDYAFSIGVQAKELQECFSALERVLRSGTPNIRYFKNGKVNVRKLPKPKE